MKSGRFTGLNVVVVGGCSDIGRHCAQIALREGGIVTITGQDEAKRALTVTNLALDGPVRSLPLDLTSAESLAIFSDELGDHFDFVDVLIIASGVTKLTTFASSSADLFDELIAVNARGPFLLMSALLPMLRGGSSVVCVSSAVASRRGRGMSAYAASKAALEAIVRTAALELADRRIRVNAVAPGPTATSGLTRPLHADDDPNARVERLAPSLPAGRLGSPAEIAQVVMFLGSQQSGGINASTIPADGGWNAA